MARIKQTKTASPGILVPIIVVIYKTTAPGAEVARIVLPTPHTSPAVYEFSDVDPGVYIVKHFSSSDGVTLETLLKDFNVDSVTNEVLSERRFYTVDGPGTYDPVSTESRIVDPYLDGKTVSGVFKEGFRFLKPIVEWQQAAGGTINFLSGITNDSNMVWVVEVQFSQVAANPGLNDPYSGIVFVTTDTALGSGQYNKTILVTSPANKVTMTLPFVGAVPDDKGYNIVHDRGNAINVIVQARPGEMIRFRGTDKNLVVLGIGEKVKVVRKSGKWYVIEPYGQWERVGEFIGWYSQLKDNCIPLLGGEYDPAVYVRLGELVDSLDPALVVDYATFNSTTTIRGEVVFHKRGFFAKDVATGRIRVPDLSNKHVRYLKNVGGLDSERVDNIPGGYQHHGIPEHQHRGFEAENTSHGAASSVQAGPNVRLLVNTTGGTVATVASAETGGVFIDGLAGSAAVADTREKNIGMIPLLCI